MSILEKLKNSDPVSKKVTEINTSIPRRKSNDAITPTQQSNSRQKPILISNPSNATVTTRVKFKVAKRETKSSPVIAFATHMLDNSVPQQRIEKLPQIVQQAMKAIDRTYDSTLDISSDVIVFFLKPFYSSHK